MLDMFIEVLFLNFIPGGLFLPGFLLQCLAVLGILAALGELATLKRSGLQTVGTIRYCQVRLGTL